MLITINSQLTLIKGSYKTDTFVYTVEYSYADNKISNMTINVSTLAGAYAGSASYTTQGFCSNVTDIASNSEINAVCNQIYTEAATSIKPTV